MDIASLLVLVGNEELRSTARFAALSLLNQTIQKAPSKVCSQLEKVDFTMPLLTALDSGLAPGCDPTDIIFTTVVMETIWQISKLPSASIQSLVSEKVINRLLAYLNVNGDFHHFHLNTREYLQKLCEGRQLHGKVKVVSMASEPLSYIHRHTYNQLKRIHPLPESVMLCRMYNTDASNDSSISSGISSDEREVKSPVGTAPMDVTACLIEKGFARQGCFPGDVITDMNDEWQEIIVTKVLDGGMFWAQVGEQNIKGVSEIQQQLNSNPVLERALTTRPGNNVVVQGCIEGTDCFLRAQILAVDSCHAEVFSLDYGYMFRAATSQIYAIPNGLLLSSKAQKISLCSVDGIQPAPQDPVPVQTAAAILANLAKQSIPAAEIMVECDGLEVIEHALQTSQDIQLSSHLITLVHNLGCIYRLHRKLENTRLVGIIVGVMSCNITDHQTQKMDADLRLLLYRCVLALISLLDRNSSTKEQFYKEDGIDITLLLIQHYGKRDGLNKLALRLIRTFVGDVDISSQLNPRLQSLVSQLTGKTSPTEVTEAASGKKSPAYDKPVKNKLTDDFVNKLKVDHRYAEKEKDLSREEEASKGTEYVKDKKMGITDSQEHEIWPVTKAATIARTSLSQHICGMLNSGNGGTVYFGMDKECRVIGMELSRDDKDRFRLGVDQLMTQLTPTLLHSQFDFRTVPVIDRDTGTNIKDLYVIELRVKSNIDRIYTVEKQCYRRFGTNNELITERKLRELIVEEEKEIYMPEMKRLKARYNQLLSGK